MADKILIHAAYPLWKKNILVTLARAKQLQSEGHDVCLTYCDSKRGTCAVNYIGSPLTCAICKRSIRKTARKLGIPTIPLDTSGVRTPDLSMYEKKQLLEGVLSGLVSTFRFLPHDIRNNRYVDCIRRRYYRTATGLLATMKAVVNEQRPDRIEVFNGRHACSKFCLLAANGAGLPFNTLEVTTETQPIVFKGHTAHDRAGIQQRIRQNDADYEAAEAYFQSRRLPKCNKYAKKHTGRFTPPNVPDGKKKVCFFLSSQDEFESLGKDWKSPFIDYAEVVKHACQRYTEFFFCVRFHPNQADIGSDVTSPFDEIAKFDNVHVYYPTEKADTYALIDWSDLVVTFGSTVSVEACWMGKPVIMLGPSFYDQLDVAYTPDSIDSFTDLLGRDLAPKERTNAAKMAHYELSDCDPMDHLRCRKGKISARGFGRSAAFLSYMARYVDVVSCHAVKALGRIRLARY